MQQNDWKALAAAIRRNKKEVRPWTLLEDDRALLYSFR
jgi:hypothetical protein